MANFFKNIGKGIGYFFAFPGLIIGIAIYAVFGLLVFIFQFFKLVYLFFTGRTLFSDLKEDIELKALLDKNNTSEEVENVEDNKKEENPLSLYPSDSIVYGAGYSSPIFSDKKEESSNEQNNKPETLENDVQEENSQNIEEDMTPIEREVFLDEEDKEGGEM
ncbi:MAG: hypothetical protein J6M95_02525 [Bacilli bacterium]|nr:hypothetical protein [Bacilli bacterium]